MLFGVTNSFPEPMPMHHHTLGNISAIKLLLIDVPTFVVQYSVQVTQLRDSLLQSIEMLTFRWSTESTMWFCTCSEAKKRQEIQALQSAV